MKVIALLAQKGGATKTTLAIHLAVAAEQDGKQTAIIDLDPQASATKWKDLRQRETPVVVSAQASRLAHILDSARQTGADLVILDTAPHSDSIAVAAARAADLILIPTKCGILDLQAISNTIDIATVAKRPAAIVLSAVPIRGATVDNAREALQPFGFEICPHSTGDRAAYRNAPNTGLTAQEYEPDGKAAEEIKTLYTWIKDKIMLHATKKIRK